MLNLVNLFAASIILASIPQSVRGFNWADYPDLSWADHCYWVGDDLSSREMTGDKCGPECGQTVGCTHFDWSNENYTSTGVGTCRLRKNSVTKDQARASSNYSMCGLMNSAQTPSSGSVTTKAIIITASVLGTVIIVGLLVLFWLKRRATTMSLEQLLLKLNHYNAPNNIVLNDLQPLNDQADSLGYSKDKYEIERSKFTLSKLLNEGEFGKVWKGELVTGSASGQTCPVAVKVPKNSNDVQHFKALTSELTVMANISFHVNVLQLVGANTKNILQHKFFVLTEFCEHGSLHDYLLNHRAVFEVPEESPMMLHSRSILLNYAYQAVCGMEHLAKSKVIHRDIALRNLLLTGDQVVKVADFGLSRQLSSYKQNRFVNNKLPLHWMAPESIMHRVYTEKSDVWSFGVLLWEIFSCSRYPTPNCEEENSFQSVANWLAKGNRLTRTMLAAPDVYLVMLKCWSNDPNERMTFTECKYAIAALLHDDQLKDLSAKLVTASNRLVSEILARHHLIAENSHVENSSAKDTSPTFAYCSSSSKITDTLLNFDGYSISNNNNNLPKSDYVSAHI